MPYYRLHKPGPAPYRPTCPRRSGSFPGAFHRSPRLRLPADWLHQPKLDDYRLQAVKERRTVRLYTKGGHDWTERLAALADALRAIPARSAILDGELVMVDAGLPSFFELHLRRGKRGAGLHLFAFDLLHMNGREVCAE